MKAKKPTKKAAPQVRETMASLRARLAEAEDTIEAIRTGHVDALVVYPEDGSQQIFTLKGADHTYRRLVETMREGAATLSAEGVVLYANAHLASMIGAPLERIMGSALRDHVCESSLPRFDAILSEGQKHACADEIELDTDRGPVSAYVSATPTDEAEPVALCVVITDLTEQKRNEEIVAAERLAASILDQAAEAIVVCDPSAQIIRASKAAHRLAQANPLHRPFAEVFPLTGEASPIERALGGEVVQGVEADFSRPDGTTAALIVAAGPLRNDRRQTLGTVVALTDVTGRKEAEQRYRFLADSMPQIVWAAQPTGEFDYYNRRWADYTGHTPEAPQTWQSVIHADDWARYQERWTHSLASGEPFEIEYQLKRNDGHHRWHLGRALAQRDGGGRIIRWFGTCTDIDDQKRAEAQAEEANRVKDEFLTTISHELRTPLTSILGWSRLLRSPKLDTATREKGLDTLERSAKAQAQLIEDLLDVSRITTGKLRLDLQPQRLDDVVAAAIDAAKPGAETKGVRLVLEPAVEDAMVVGDGVRLQQVAWNLLTNAIKFTPRGGVVRAAVQRVGNALELSVTDDGAGIDPEFLPYVFDRFRQADSSITRNKSGLGLGLSIVRNLVELHGGTVAVHSDGLGKGARFVVRLPSISSSASPRPSGVESTATTASGDLTGVRVLVVDDEADARDLLAFMLAQHGAEVRVAGSAREALESIVHQPPDVLVSDIGMPGEDGYSLIEKVRALGPGAGELPAIALTAYTRPEDRLRALRAGFQMHVAKPIEPLELVLVVSGLAAVPPRRVAS